MPKFINISWRSKIDTLIRVSRYRPKFTAAIVVLGGLTAFLEGVGLSFIHPILKVAQTDQPSTAAEGGVFGIFVDAYELLGILFTMEFLTFGIASVLTVRFIMSFLIAWLRAILQKQQEGELRTRTFDAATRPKLATSIRTDPTT